MMNEESSVWIGEEKFIEDYLGISRKPYQPDVVDYRNGTEGTIGESVDLFSNDFTFDIRTDERESVLSMTKKQAMRRRRDEKKRSELKKLGDQLELF